MAIKKYAPALVIISSVGGFIGDVLQPLGPILFYTLILALAAAILLTITRNKFGGKVRVAIGFLWIWC
jgi:hypothetical protein